MSGFEIAGLVLGAVGVVSVLQTGCQLVKWQRRKNKLRHLVGRPGPESNDSASGLELRRKVASSLSEAATRGFTLPMDRCWLWATVGLSPFLRHCALGIIEKKVSLLTVRQTDISKEQLKDVIIIILPAELLGTLRQAHTTNNDIANADQLTTLTAGRCETTLSTFT